MTARPSADQQHRSFEIAIVGNDLMLAALPGRPLQVAHAILACGYDLVVPESWGEELIARYALDMLDEAGKRPMVFCACPKVRNRLMAAGTELLPHLISCVAPPAAAARYLRALEPDVRMRVTYIGGCPGAADTSIDVRIPPADFLRHVESRGISVIRQPLVFESVIPPDRRRHLSLPGGVPTPEATADRGFHFSLVLEGDDLATEIAEHLLAMENVLIDMAPALGCVCAGAVAGGSREAVLALEPPRSPLPVIEGSVHVALHSASTNDALPADTPIPTTEEPATVKRETPEVMPPGVHSIEDAARRRAERRRIAVTPPGARATAAQPVRAAAPLTASAAESPKAKGREEPVPVVSADRADIASAPEPREVPVAGSDAGDEVDVATGAAPEEPEVAAAPSEVGVAVAETPTEGDVTSESPPEPVASPAPAPDDSPPVPMPSELPVIATRIAAASEPATVPDPSTTAVVRHRTPVFGVWHSSRATARQRVVARQGTTVPRAYNAIRHRTGEVVTVAAPVEITEAPVRVEREVVASQPSDVKIGKVTAVAAAVLQPEAALGSFPAEPGKSGRRASRRIDAHGVGRRSRLWGLLMSILLITALTITLLLIFGA